MKGLIHIGANDGREYVGTNRLTWLIEPLTAPHERLAEIHQGNANIIAAQFALGASEGRVKLHLANNGQCSSSILSPHKHLEIMPNIHFEGTEEVNMTTLDALVSAYGWEGRFDEIVIDVQGYELEALKGAVKTLKDIQKIKAEVNRDELYVGCTRIEALDAFLAEQGFERVSVDWYGDSWGDAEYERKIS